LIENEEIGNRFRRESGRIIMARTEYKKEVETVVKLYQEMV
jgi:hypothetical protein